MKHISETSRINYWRIRVGRFMSYWQFARKSKLNNLEASSIWMDYVSEKLKWKKDI